MARLADMATPQPGVLTRRQFLAHSALLCSAPAWVRGAAELTEAERAPLDRALKFPLIDAHLHYVGEHRPSCSGWPTTT